MFVHIGFDFVHERWFSQVVIGDILSFILKNVFTSIKYMNAQDKNRVQLNQTRVIANQGIRIVLPI